MEHTRYHRGTYKRRNLSETFSYVETPVLSRPGQTVQLAKLSAQLHMPTQTGRLSDEVIGDFLNRVGRLRAFGSLGSCFHRPQLRSRAFRRTIRFALKANGEVDFRLNSGMGKGCWKSARRRIPIEAQPTAGWKRVG